jgi:hypothetical protein
MEIKEGGSLVTSPYKAQEKLSEQKNLFLQSKTCLLCALMEAETEMDQGDGGSTGKVGLLWKSQIRRLPK